MTRRYAPHRRAYYPRIWPLAIVIGLAVGVTIYVIQVHTVLGTLACAFGAAVVGAVGSHLQWTVWRKRHPEITPAERMHDIRDAAPWN